MTSLRFVGSLPLLPGLLLALLVGVMSWRYYRRESLELPRRLRWFLPMLRSLAFFLGVMVLTGPVLHHRTIVGELGQVKVYVDASNSMTLLDPQMSAGRKLLVAEQLGWLNRGSIDASLSELANDLADARHDLVARLSDTVDGAAVAAASREFVRRLKSVESEMPAAARERLATELLQPLAALTENRDAEPMSTVDQLMALAEVCQALESELRAQFEETVDAVVAVGDESIRSALTMFDETTRWRRTELGLLDSPADLIAKLRQEHDVELLTLVGEEAVTQHVLAPDTRLDGAEPMLSSAVAAPTEPVQTLANLTDLSSGIVAHQAGNARSAEAGDATGPAQAAVVLLTDGQHNSGPSPLQTARILGSQGIPLYCVAIGATRQAPDLAVVGLEHPQQVFQKDRVRGVMIMRDEMPAGEPFVAQIRYQEKVLWQRQLTTLDVSERRLEFEFTIDDLVADLEHQFDSEVQQHAIPLALQASIAPLPAESETSNNQRTFRLAVITGRHHVLIIDGRSRWETRYLRNVFERDDRWQVSTIIAGPGTDHETLPRGELDGQFPADRDGIFEYDMIIFGEVSPSLLTEKEFEWLQEFVAIRGGGMVFIDGRRGKLRQLAERSLATLLPIVSLPDTISSPPTSLELTERGALQSALKLAVDDPQNRRLWSELPPPHTVTLVDALPDAEVLAVVNVDGQQRPAVVTRAFGAGRVLYLAFDETWRWRYKAADTWHQRIWNQLATFVMPRPFAVSDEFVSIDSGPVSYEFGDSVDIRVRLLGLDGKPADDATVDALLWKDDRVVATVSLDADAEVPGIYRGRSDKLEEGDFEVSIQAAGYSESVLKARTEFEVRPAESDEMARTAANALLLNQMAVASGGLYLREEELGKLPEILRPLSHGRVVESETLIWQSYWWFAAIVMLVTTEWMLRKRAGLL